MSREFRFEDPGEGIHEGEVTEVLVSVGDEVNEGDDVLVVETDKATTELPSPYTGTIEEIRVGEGDVIEVGDVMITFSGGEETEASKETEAAEQKKQEPEKEKHAGGKSQREAQDTGGKAAAVGELPEAEPKTGQRKDRSEKSADESDPSEQPQRKQRKEAPIPASPATRRLARELEVDLADVKPSGPHGRVTRSDVEAAAEKKSPDKTSRERPAAEQRPAPELPDFERWGPVERVPLRGVRRTTLRRMSVAWQQIPHVTHHDEIDVTDLERWRRQQNAEREQDESELSLTALMLKAVAAMLKRYPRFNASLDLEQQEVILKHYYHIGLAIDTDDGLIVGVVRDVDRKSLRELAADTQEVVQRVRRREVSKEELKGATFTLTNVGPLGGTSFTPLVNYPEVGILGMARTRLTQVVSGDLEDPQTDVRLLLPLSFSFDHRVNDGADAARFVSELGGILAGPDALLLNV